MPIRDYFPRASALSGFGQTRRDAARTDLPETRGWRPNLRHAPSRYASDQRNIMGRARDLDENNGWINGALDRRVEAVVGVDIRLMPQPIHSMLGQDFSWRMAWSADVADRFRAWANDIDRRNDVKGEFSFGAQMRLSYLAYMRDGGATAMVKDRRTGAGNRTQVLLIEYERIETPPEMKWKEGDQLRNGIRRDADGRVIGYYVRNHHPDDSSQPASYPGWTYVPARGRTGRAKMVHVYSPRRIEQDRGVSKLAEAMIPAKMLDSVDRAEVQAALKSALLSIFIKAPGDTEDLEAALAPTGPDSDKQDLWLDDYVSYREQNPIHMDGSEIAQLLPGEGVETPDQMRPNAAYGDFVRTVLQKVAGSIGISLPQISQNWSDINYSSARALLNELWRSFLQDRHFFTQQFCTPIYAAWLEREVAMRAVTIPGGPLNFYENKTALCMASWIGPGRGSVDPQKEANANNLDEAAGRASTPESIVERGRDPAEVIAEQAHYDRQRTEAGLDPVNRNVKAAADAAQSSDTEGQTENEQQQDPEERPEE